MRKQDIVDLIEAHVKRNDTFFMNKAYEIAKEFYESGDADIANYIIGQLTPSLRMDTQTNSDVQTSSFFKELEPSSDSFIVPEQLMEQLKGIVNAVAKDIGISKFLFVGNPGTGKTEAVKQLARVLHRRIFVIDFDEIIDSRLGMTQKNITSLFKEMNRFSNPKSAIFLFDELDAIALDRINSNDIREMGRASTSLLKGLDSLNRNVMLIATTNLHKNLDKAISRRFDAVINFNQYSTNDLVEIALSYIDSVAKKGVTIEKDSRLLRKIINISGEELTPGRLKNILRTSIAFGDYNSKDYLRRFYLTTRGDYVSKEKELNNLKKNNFTLREMEILTLISKSELSRFFNEEQE